MATLAQPSTPPEKPIPSAYQGASQEPPLTEDQHRRLVAVAAYYLAERRNFEPGFEVQDWLAAELQVGSEGMTIS
jgi:hypothetical protein